MATIAANSDSGSAPVQVLPAATLRAAVEAVEVLGACSADYDALTDAELLAGQKALARVGELLETRQVWLAKAVAHRSRRELGQAGLAARQGFLSPDELLQNLTGSSRKDARKLVDVGRMLADTEAAAEALVAGEADGAGGVGGSGGFGVDEAGTPPGLLDDQATGSPPAGVPQNLPWFSPISAAVLTGSLSVTAAHAIRTGLGTVNTVVTAEKLSGAVRSLLEDAKTMNVDRLLKRARQMREGLDAAGVAVREQKAWDARYLRIWTLETGQVHIHGLFPPEQGAYILSVYDSLTGPRRGGVRFVDADRAAWAKAVQDDPRSTEQMAADTFLELLKAGSTVNPNRMLGGRNPAVRVLITAGGANGGTDSPAHAPTAQEPAKPAPAQAQAEPQPLTQSVPAAPPSPPSPPGQRSPAPQAPLQPQPAPVASSAPPAHGSAPVPLAAPEHTPPPSALRPAAHATPPPPEPEPEPLPPGFGPGYIEGSTSAVSRETIDRLICDSGTIEVTFDQHGQPLNLGREERLFNQAQRAALAARDGGCRWGDCDRPPSATEAHHLEEWVRDTGGTDIRLGILLCNPHHRLLHNQGWRIFENQGRYWLRPPATVDPGQAPIELSSKNPATPAQEAHRHGPLAG